MFHSFSCVLIIAVFCSAISASSSAKAAKSRPEVILVIGRVNVRLPEWEFKVIFSVENQIKAIKKVEIRESISKRLLQTLDYALGDTVEKDQNPLELADTNSDGYLDLHILTVCGNKGCDDRCWLFEPKSKKFVYSESHSINFRPRKL